MENQSGVYVVTKVNSIPEPAKLIGSKDRAFTIILILISIVSIVPVLMWSYYVFIFSSLSFGSGESSSFLLETMILIGLLSPLLIVLAGIVGFVFGFRKNNRWWFFLPHLVSVVLYLLVKLGMVLL